MISCSPLSHNSAIFTSRKSDIFPGYLGSHDFGHFSVKTVTKATTICPDKLTNVWGYADAAFARIDYNRFGCLCSSVFPAGLVSCATIVGGCDPLPWAAYGDGGAAGDGA